MTRKMKFHKDFFVDGGSEIRFEKNKIYDIPLESVDRWLKRGAELVVDDEHASDRLLQAQMDASLAETLKEEGKGSEAEATAAVAKAEHIEEIEAEEIIEEEEQDEKEEAPVSRTTKKKTAKKRR
jgi:hypothetical protein